MHLVSAEVQAAVSIPLIDIIRETGETLKQAGHSRPLLLATRYTMEHGFYADRMEATVGFRPIVPNAEDRTLVHRVIFEELCAGHVDPSSARAFEAVVERGRAAGADSVILGCTEIGLLVRPDALALAGLLLHRNPRGSGGALRPRRRSGNRHRDGECQASRTRCSIG